jgi:hypothetical protein
MATIIQTSPNGSGRTGKEFELPAGFLVLPRASDLVRPWGAPNGKPDSTPCEVLRIRSDLRE